MKKQIAVLCTVLLWVCAVFAPMARAAGPALSATEAYCIIDAAPGRVVAQQNMDAALHPASNPKVVPSRGRIPATLPCRRGSMCP